MQFGMFINCIMFVSLMRLASIIHTYYIKQIKHVCYNRRPEVDRKSAGRAVLLFFFGASIV